MIAIHLGISPRTVEIYRAHLMEKLGTHSLSETLRIAFTRRNCLSIRNRQLWLRLIGRTS
jgi:DNA-binding NarL/FixJ family response regulator